MALNKTFDLGDINFGEKQAPAHQASTKEVKKADKNPLKQEIIEEAPPTPADTEADNSSEPKDSSSGTGVKLISNKKSLKTEHKNFLFDKELADQLKKVAKRTGLSENEVVSQILKQTLFQILDD